MKTRSFIIFSSNKRERTITFKVYDRNGQFSAKYKTISLDHDTFRYYTEFATTGDWEAFMKTDDYYKMW